MEWYTKYLSIFGLTLSEIPGDTLSEIGTLLHEKQSDTPLVSVVVIAHNEEPHNIKLPLVSWQQRIQLPHRDFSGQQSFHRPDGAGIASGRSHLLQRT